MLGAKKLTTLFLNWIVAVVTENQKLKSTLFLNPSAVLRASKKLSFFRLNGSTLLIIRRRRRRRRRNRRRNRRRRRNRDNRGYWL